MKKFYKQLTVNYLLNPGTWTRPKVNTERSQMNNKSRIKLCFHNKSVHYSWKLHGKVNYLIKTGVFSLWYLSKERRNLLFPSFSLIQMISHLAEMSMDNKFCLYCKVYYNNTVDHCINTCTYLGLERARLWSDIQNISIQAYVPLYLRQKPCV